MSRAATTVYVVIATIYIIQVLFKVLKLSVKYASHTLRVSKIKVI